MEIIDSTDYEAINIRDAKIGEQIIEMLSLHPIQEGGQTRYNTSWGTKSNIGLARSIARIFEETK